VFLSNLFVLSDDFELLCVDYDVQPVSIYLLKYLAGSIRRYVVEHMSCIVA